jgi:2-polyprenyl-6-hydroxyphenyl methylase/3-demethylubiquinone-9 3-methyltransferase
MSFIERERLDGVDFLDIGCGSGLHSYAAFQAGAKRIHSFDYDENSVAATKMLWEKAGSPAHWTIERGDALKKEYIANLGKWSFVYSWGVLHHTGSMWEAVRNAQSCVRDGGIFYIALYAKDVQPEADMWLRVKKEYVENGWLKRRQLEWWYIWTYMLGKDAKRLPEFFKRMSEHRKTRGMDLMTDIRDWLGGWPMEFAGDQETVDLLEGECGFRLVNVSTGEACSEFLFEKTGAPAVRTNVKEFDAQARAKRAQKAAQTASAA